MEKSNFINKIRNIYCIGRNYAAHAAELGNETPKSPVLFLKSTASARMLNESGKVAYPLEEFHHEAELVLFIGETPPQQDHASPLAQISAIGLGIDVTRRAVQSQLKKQGLPWTDAKSFIGAAVFTTPVSVTHDAFQKLGDEWPRQIEFELHINGACRQNGSPKNMIFDLVTILRHIDASHGLLPGDVIFTGTPEGVGPLKCGDQLRLVMTLGGTSILDESGIF